MGDVTFIEDWKRAVEAKNSVLCAGLDPAVFGMGRGEKGLADRVSKRDWALRYVEAVAPFAAALKPNVQYWRGEGDHRTLLEIAGLAEDKGLVVIDDSKFADIGSTNDAGMWHSHGRWSDAVTIAPYAGNMKEAADMAHAHGLGAITMCLMSNPEYARRKTELVRLMGEEVDAFSETDLMNVDGVSYVQQYKFLAQQAAAHGLDGIVIGAPSPKNHLTENEVATAAHYAGERPIVLMPGVGAQGGDPQLGWRHFAADQIAVNVGRALMLPSGSHSTPEEQAATAQMLQKQFNRYRAE